jgi:hypothetical protein
MSASFQELLDALEFVSLDGGLGGNSALLCRESGKIYWQFADSPELNNELPDEIDGDETYIRLPDKRDLGLGKPLVLEFVREFLPDDFDEVRYIFSKRGAYAKFRALLARRRAVDRWHNFESQATERALRDWCEVNSIEVVD